MNTRALFAWLVLVVLTLAARPAWADATDDQVAEIKRRGDEALVSGRPAEALAAYKEAYAKKPDPALLYNQGRALQALGDYPAAVEELEAFDRDAPAELKAKVSGLAGLLSELRQKVSQVAIVCDEPGATVRLRDHTIGTTPVSAVVRVLAGPGTLEVTKEGFFTYKRDLVLPPGGLASVEVRLLSKQTAGILTVTSTVVGAAVAVDGKHEGMVPTEVTLQSGNHRVDVTRDGYKAATSMVVVAAGERRSIDIGLEGEAPITKKWWFWTGLGVLAVGATVTVIALTTEKSPGSGTVAPGRISAGLTF